MKLDRMTENNEEVLWEGAKSESPSFWEAVFSPALVFTIIWAMIFAFIFIAMIAAEGFSPLFLLMLLFLIMPVPIYISRLRMSKYQARNTHYSVTTKGVYIRTGAGGFQNTQFIPFSQIREAQATRRRFDEKCDTGTVYCQYVTPVESYNGNEYQTEFGFQLMHLTEYREAVKIINAQIEEARWSERMDAAMLRQDSSEQSAPGTYAAEAKDATDPRAAFLGPKGRILKEYDEGDSMSAEQRAYLKQLPDESVSALQAELFGTDAEQQGAFADPTVNPLPELPEPPQDNEQGQLMQRGL